MVKQDEARVLDHD